MNLYGLMGLVLMAAPACGSVFVPRAALQMLVPREETSCFEVPWIPSHEQCSFVSQNCRDEATIFAGVNFLKLYYCNPVSKVVGIAVLVLLLLLAFVLIGITASEFLCINLHTIAKCLQLNDNIAGLTLLALGNGSPDVISTYKAMEMGSGGLAVSELIGASFFITTVVVGSMVIVHPFKLPKRPFLRDLSFFICISCFILISVYNGYLSLSNSIALIAVYVFYVLFVMINHSISTSNTLRALREERVRSNFVLNNLNHEEEPEDEESFNSAVFDKFSSLPSIEEMNLHNINEYDEDYQRELITEYDQFRRHTDESYNIDSTRSFGLKQLIGELTKHSHVVTNRILLRDRADPYAPSEPILMLDQEDQEPTHFEPQQLPAYLDFLYKIHPALRNFRDLTVLEKLMVPISFVLRVSTPVVDFHELEAPESDEESEPTKALDTEVGRCSVYHLQLVVSSVFLNVFFYSGFKTFLFIHIPLTSFFSGVLVKLNDKRPFAFLGFVQSIVWITIFATIIISLLRTFSIMFDLSDEIIGLTVFAVGNCVGDFIANFTIAKMGMPIMAFGACFGSPLLTLSSMGLSALIILSKNENYSKTFINDFGYLIQSDRTLVVLNLSLIFNLFLILGLAMRNDWSLTRRSGYILIGNWVVTTTICCIIELTKF